MMELELGLALPNHQISSSTSTPMVMKGGLDLNSAYKVVEMAAKHKHHPMFIGDDHNQGCSDDHGEVESKDLSLLLWSGQPNDQDDDHRWTDDLRINDDDMMNDEEAEEIVGWPPINSLMKKELLHRNHGAGRGWMHQANHHHQHRVHIPAAPRNNNNSMYVKVKMEGVPIGRKIDLRLYHSYQALTHAFIHMFAKYNKNENRDGEEYRILYQDREGDWMLAGDVPWETFVESVRRVEIVLRKDDY